MFDTHCHLSDASWTERLPETLQAAHAVGVHHFLSVSSAEKDWQALTRITSHYPEVTPAFGIHPLFISTASAHLPTELEQYLLDYPGAPVGEIGLDFYNHPDIKEQERQKEFFSAQICLARDAARPIVLHQRKAEEECLAFLKDNRFTCGGFAHAFSGSREQAKKWLDAGFLIGIGTTLLKARARKLPELIPYLPPDGWVLESDAPFMRADNRPSILLRIAQYAAGIRGESIQKTIRDTTQNALRILQK